MPLYEFVLRTAGRADEVRISDYNGLREGDEVMIANRRWVVARLDQPDNQRPDGVAVRRRLTLHPRACATEKQPAAEANR